MLGLGALCFRCSSGLIEKSALTLMLSYDFLMPPPVSIDPVGAVRVGTALMIEMGCAFDAPHLRSDYLVRLIGAVRSVSVWCRSPRFRYESRQIQRSTMRSANLAKSKARTRRNSETVRPDLQLSAGSMIPPGARRNMFPNRGGRGQPARPLRKSLIVQCPSMRHASSKAIQELLC
jgi:hypothetical protein